MNCESCKVKIGAEFVFALKQNKCPACGESIMEGTKLSSFLSLQTLLRSNFQDLDIERIASLIVANFELVQIFKDSDEIKSSQSAAIIKPLTKEEEDKKFDEEFKKKQIEEARKIKQMRDEALEEATADQWGLGNANAFLEEGDVREMAHFEKRQQQTENILTGSKGSFRRT